MSVSLHRVANNAVGLVQNNPLAIGGTNLTVDSALDNKLLGIGSFPFWLTLWNANTTPDTDTTVEIVEVTARPSPNNYTITRAQQGTAAIARAYLSNVGLLWTKGNAQEVTTLDAIAAKGSIVYYDATGTPKVLAPGTDGYELVADSSQTAGLKWQTTAQSVPPSTIAASVFETAARFFTIQLGAGNAATFDTAGLTITDAANGNGREIDWGGGSNTPYAGSPSFSCTFRLNSKTGTSFGYCGLGDQMMAGATWASTKKHIGFVVKIVAATASLYATQGDGSTETISSALTTIAAGDVVEVYLKVNTTASVDYYWRINGGAWSSATNLTTNIPSGANTGNAACCDFSEVVTAAASSNSYSFYNFAYQR